MIPPLLMLGGAYLCFEGGGEGLALAFAETLRCGRGNGQEDWPASIAAHLEEQKVKGAIKTDFILSAEIMTISLAAIGDQQFVWLRGGGLGRCGHCYHRSWSTARWR